MVVNQVMNTAVGGAAPLSSEYQIRYFAKSSKAMPAGSADLSVSYDEFSGGLDYILVICGNRKRLYEPRSRSRNAERACLR
jgi:hypothetical protein